MDKLFHNNLKNDVEHIQTKTNPINASSKCIGAQSNNNMSSETTTKAPIGPSTSGLSVFFWLLVV